MTSAPPVGKSFLWELFCALLSMHAVLTVFRIVHTCELLVSYPEEFTPGTSCIDIAIEPSIYFFPDPEVIFGAAVFYVLYRLWERRSFAPKRFSIEWGCLAGIYGIGLEVLAEERSLPFLNGATKLGISLSHDSIFVAGYFLLPQLLIGLCVLFFNKK